MDSLNELTLAGYNVGFLAIQSHIYVHGLASTIENAKNFINFFVNKMEHRELSDYEEGQFRCYTDFCIRHTEKEFNSSVHMDQAEEGIRIDKDGLIC
jgi:hypothetical protein